MEPKYTPDRLVAGPGIRIDRHPCGTTISAVPAEQPSGGGGGGNLSLAAVVTAPAGGFGVGEAAAIDVNSDGTYSVSSGGAVVGYINLYL